MCVCSNCKNNETTIELIGGKPVKTQLCIYNHLWFQHSDAVNCKDYEPEPQIED